MDVGRRQGQKPADDRRPEPRRNVAGSGAGQMRASTARQPKVEHSSNRQRRQEDALSRWGLPKRARKVGFGHWQPHQCTPAPRTIPLPGGPGQADRRWQRHRIDLPVGRMTSPASASVLSTRSLIASGREKSAVLACIPAGRVVPCSDRLPAVANCTCSHHPTGGTPIKSPASRRHFLKTASTGAVLALTATSYAKIVGATSGSHWG